MSICAHRENGVRCSLTALDNSLYCDDHKPKLWSNSDETKRDSKWTTDAFASDYDPNDKDTLL